MSFFAGFKKSWAFIVIILLFGILLLFLSFSDETFIASKGIKDALRIAGQTVLSSAVFLGVVKTLQYSDYFKDEINEVMFTDKYLKTLSVPSLKDKWILVTNALHSNTFPSLSNNLNHHLLNGIISTPKNYTHSNMRITFTIAEIGEERRFFKLTEKVNMIINGQKDTTVNFRFQSHIIKENDPEDLSSIKLTQFTIDGEDKLGDGQEAVSNLFQDNMIKESIEKNDVLTSKESFSIVRELETVHSTKMNGYWKSDFETFVEDSLEITLHFDEKVFEVDLLGIGQTIKLVKDTFDKKTVKYTCKNLIFQNDCLILITQYK